MKKKYFFLYLNTGGGHISSAKALAKYLESNYSEEIEPVLINGFEKVSKTARFLVEDGYRTTQDKAMWFFEFLYYFNKQKLWAQWNNFVVGEFCRKSLEEKILAEKPAKIIVLHFFLNKPILDIVKKHNLNIPVITVITDPYTASPIWYQTKKQQFIVFSDRVKNDMIRRKVPVENIQVFPFFLNEKYQTRLLPDKVLELKVKFGISASKKIIMVIGGGDGLPHGDKIIRSLLKASVDAEILVVCGKNEGFKIQAEELQKEFNATNLKIHGFIDFVYELMNISDLVITKGGPSTLMEILILEKVPVINSYIWEQEKGNMEFVVENGMGIYEPNADKLPAVVHRLFSDTTYYAEFIEKIRHCKIENGTQQVGEFIRNYSK